MAIEHNYKGDLILEYGKGDYEAFVFNADGDIENESFISLAKAKKWIDKYGSTRRNE